MSAVPHHLEFAPPATPGTVRSVLLALLAHLLLVAVLAVGVAWKRETPPVAVEAELWSSIPQEAAPPPPPEPEPEPPEPEPPLPVRPAPPPAPPVADVPKAADIALAKEKEEKARLQKEKELQQAKLDQERKAQQDKKSKELKQREKLAQEKALKEKAAKEKAEKAKLAEAAKQKDKTSQADARRLEDERKRNIAKMLAQAGGTGTGSAGSTGTAAQSTGPSNTYEGRIRARIKPNVTFVGTITGNPKTEIEIHLSPDGTIISQRVVKASGTKSWDDAALNAIIKTEKLPKDENGRIHTPMIIEISPQTLLGP